MNGSVIDVRVYNELDEVVGVNPQYASRPGSNRDRAVPAMAQVSGCPILDVSGDAAVTVGVSGCDREWVKRRKLTEITRPSYDCIDYGYSGEHGFHMFGCTPCLDTRNPAQFRQDVVDKSTQYPIFCAIKLTPSLRLRRLVIHGNHLASSHCVLANSN